MKRVLLVVVVLVAVMVGLVFWLEDDRVAMREDERTRAEDKALAPKPSKWNEPIVARGTRKLTGVVLRDGVPYSGAVITALQAHGEEVLSDLPCQCDNHCGQKLLQCGCAEAAGQLVELVGHRTGEAIPLGRATSATDGTFSIEGLDESLLTLWADGTNVIAWKTDVASDAADVKLELLEGRTLTGTAKKTDGSPASGAVVTAIFSEQSRFFETTVRADGSFSIGPMPSGKYAVVAMQAGLLPDHHQVADDDDEALEFELNAPRVLSGTVTKNGAPVTGATVKLDGMHRKRTVTTDGNGAFRIEQLRPGKYDLTARGAGGLGATSTQVSKTEDRSNVVIELEDGVPLDGVVVDERGAPVKAVTVQVNAGKEWLRAESDEAGQFHFDVVPVGERELWARKDGFLSLEREKVTGGAAPLRLTLSRAAMVTGTVRTDDGTPVTDFSVTAYLADAGSFDDDLDSYELGVESAKSKDGGFSLPLRAGESYRIEVEPALYGTATVLTTAPREGLNVVVKPGAMLRGRVFSPDLQPAPRVFVAASSKGKPTKTVETDAAGRYTMGGLSAGEWAVSAHSRSMSSGMWSANATVQLADTGTTELDLRTRAGAMLSGVVIDAKGAPAQKVMLTAMSTVRNEDTRPQFESATSDAEGRFSFKTIPPGKAVIHVAELRKSVTVVVPDANVIVKLEPATTLEGRVVDEAGKPVTEFRIMTRSFSDEGGRFSLPSRKGKAELAFAAEGFAQLMMDVEVKEGVNDLGVIKLSRGVTLTGVVRDAETGAPIAGALVDVSNNEPKGNFRLSPAWGAATTDKQGHYSLKVDATSTWVNATHPSYESTAKLRGAATTFDLALNRGGSLTVTVLDEKGQPTRDAYVMGSSNGQSAPFKPSKTGVFEISGLRPSTWTVNATSRRLLYRSQTVTLAGAPAQLTFKPEVGTVEVTFTGNTGSWDVALVNTTVRDVKTYMSTFSSVASVQVKPGQPAAVFPGEWTVVMSDEENIAVQPLGELKNSTTVQLNPKWEPLPEWPP